MNHYLSPERHQAGVPMSNFSWEIQSGTLIIEDLNLEGGRSVTNDVDLVCQHIRTAEGNQTYDDLAGIIYRDSEGSYDEIQKDGTVKALRKKVDGKFLEIADKDEAIAVISAKKGCNWQPDEIAI